MLFIYNFLICSNTYLLFLHLFDCILVSSYILVRFSPPTLAALFSFFHRLVSNSVCCLLPGRYLSSGFIWALQDGFLKRKNSCLLPLITSLVKALRQNHRWLWAKRREEPRRHRRVRCCCSSQVFNWNKSLLNSLLLSEKTWLSWMLNKLRQYQSVTVGFLNNLCDSSFKHHGETVEILQISSAHSSIKWDVNCPPTASCQPLAIKPTSRSSSPTPPICHV